MRRLRSVVVGIIALAVSLAASAPARADAILSIDPSTSILQVGDTVTFDFDISGATDLYGFSFDVLFDPSVLSAPVVESGTVLGDSSVADFLPGFDDGFGTISLITGLIYGDVSGVSAPGTLASITFTVLGLTDKSLVTMTNVLLLDSSLMETTLGGTSATFSTVPEPSSLALLGVGLAALYGRRRSSQRKRTKKSHDHLDP